MDIASPVLDLGRAFLPTPQENFETHPHPTSHTPHPIPYTPHKDLSALDGTNTHKLAGTTLKFIGVFPK